MPEGCRGKEKGLRTVFRRQRERKELERSNQKGKGRRYSLLDKEWSVVSRATDKLGRRAHKRPLDLRIRRLLIFRGADSVNYGG